jgi:tellurite resistance protein TerC
MEKISEIFTNHAVISQNAMWGIFSVVVIFLLFTDLFVFNRKNEVPNFVHTFWICVFYIASGLLFGVFVIYEKGMDAGMLYFTGFLVEKSLSMDNIFVISMIFTTIGVPREYQHRVLFWGIVGAIVLRAVLILAGEALISNFEWILYVFSLFLIYTGIKMFMHNDEDEVKLEDKKIYKMLTKIFHVTDKIHGHHFFVKQNGNLYMTPLFFALIMIELMDVVFALDSIPAIFLITTDLFIVYTSNIFAILGLRALYFLLEAAVNKFKYLKPALSIILIFIGIKIFMPIIGLHIEPIHSLIVTFGLLLGSIFLSLVKDIKKETTS